MKIFYITDEVFTASEAPSIHVHEVARHFVQAGHLVTLFLPTRSRLSKESPEYSVRQISCPSALSSIFFQVQFLFQFLKTKSTAKPDVLYVRHNLLLIVPTILGKIYNIPVTLEVNGKLIEELKSQNPNFMSKTFLFFRLYSLIEYINLRFASNVITVTEGLQKYLSKTYALPAKTFTTIANGVDVDFFTPKDKKLAREAINYSDKHAFVVGYIGSMYHWQGLRFLVEASAIVRQTHPQIRFLLIGDGAEKESLAKQVTEANVGDIFEIRDSVPHATVPDYINSFDIAVSIPTNFRAGATSPFKVYEYLACATPIIQTDIVGVRDELADLVNYTEAESAVALAKTIITLFNQDNDLQKIATERRDRIVDSRSWEAVTEATLKLLEKAVYSK